MVLSSWIPISIIWLILALAHLVVPLALFRHRPGEKRAKRLTVLYGGLAAVWGMGGALTAFVEPAPAIAESAGLVISGLAPAIVGLLVMLEYAFTGQGSGWLWSIVGSVWAVLVFAVAQYSRKFGNVPWASSAVSAFGWGSIGAAMLVIWVRQYTQAQWTFRRNRSLYWMGAAALIMGGQALVLFATQPVGPVGLLLHLGGLIAITVGITRQQNLPHVRARLRQGLAFAVLAALMAALFLSGLLVLSPSLRTQPLQQRAAVGLATLVAVTLGIVYRPLHDFAVRLADRLVPRTGYDPAEVLREYSLAIGNIIDLKQLAAVAVGTVSKVLDVQRGALILVTETGHEIRLWPLKGIGDIPREEVSFDIHSPVIEHLEGKQRSLFQHHLEHAPAFHNLAPEEEEWFRKMGMEVYVPILAQSIFLGILAVGPPHSGEPFGQREWSFLTTLANQTAVALQNARMFDNMRELNFDIIKLNEDLRRAKERLERLDRAKTDFLTIASHELRTPLTQIKGYADVMAELSTAQAITMGQIDTITHSIGRATDRLETIVNAMLDMSQIEVDALDLFFAPTTLKAVMRMALEPWMKPIQLRRLHLTVEGVEDIPPIVVDLQRLCQVFGNLVSNAIKYTPDGGSIVVRARQIDDARFEVVVADTGLGIDPTDQELVFDKFFRVDSPDHHSSGEFKFKGAGPGLGLSIARGVVEAHGGRIWVVSERYDEKRCPGSAFHVVLPLKACPPTAETLATEPPAIEHPVAEKVMPFITW